MPVVIVVELPGCRGLPNSAVAPVAAAGAKLLAVSSVEQALSVLSNVNNLQVLLVNSPEYDLLKLVRKTHPSCKTILLTDQPMLAYASALQNEETELLDHVVGYLSEAWVIRDVRVTVQKILRGDLFGAEKYLRPEAVMQREVVRGSLDRERLNAQVLSWVERCGVGKNLGRLAFGISEEMLMNAIYDAPVAGGRKHYDQLSRTEARQLVEDEFAELSYGADGELLALSIRDPFGAFKRDVFFKYLKKVLRRHDSEALIDSKKGGAGLGLFKILYNSHAVICNVDPGKRTEVVALIDLAQPVRDFSQMPRSIHFFTK